MFYFTYAQRSILLSSYFLKKRQSSSSSHQITVEYNFNFIAASKPAQRVFKINMLFPTSVLCNEAGQGVLRQKVRTAINALNRDWNYCSYSLEGKLIFIQVNAISSESDLLDASG